MHSEGSGSCFKELLPCSVPLCVLGAALRPRASLPCLQGALSFFILPDAFWRVPFGESVWRLNTLKDVGTWRKDATWLGLQVRL